MGVRRCAAEALDTPPTEHEDFILELKSSGNIGRMVGQSETGRRFTRRSAKWSFGTWAGAPATLRSRT